MTLWNRWKDRQVKLPLHSENLLCGFCKTSCYDIMSKLNSKLRQMLVKIPVLNNIIQERRKIKKIN